MYTHIVLDPASVGVCGKLFHDDFGFDPDVSLHGSDLGEVVVRLDEGPIVLAHDDVDAFGVVHAQIMPGFLAAF